MSAWVHDPGLVLIAGLTAHDTARFAEQAFAGAVMPPAGDVDAALRRRELGVVPLTDLNKDTLDPFLVIAKRRHLPCVVLVLDADPEVVLARSSEDERPTLRGLKHNARTLESRLPAFQRKVVASVQRLGDALPAVERRRLPCDRADLTGPFDVIGDVHGCLSELTELLTELGYSDEDGVWKHPERTCVFVGDLTDRGPNSVGVLRLVSRMVHAGSGLCVMGNHDHKLARYFEGRPKLKVGHGMETTVAEFEALDPVEQAFFRARARGLLEALPSHLILDGGKLVVAHGGIRGDLIGRMGARVQAFTRFGDTTGKTDADGYPERRDWAATYRGTAHVIYGHTPVDVAEWRNKTANVDQGCVFGGQLTAARWPEKVFVSVPARRAYWER